VHADAGVPVAGTPLTLTATDGFAATLHADVNGAFAVALPYGRYELSGVAVFIRALQSTRVDVSIDAAGTVRAVKQPLSEAGIWTDETHGRLYPEPFSLAGVLLSREPLIVTEPLDF